MRSLTLSQWKDLRMGVICEDLGALTTARACKRSTWYDILSSSATSRVAVRHTRVISVKRTTFRLAVLTYIPIHLRTSASYLQSCFTRVADMTSRRRLRSSASHRLEVKVKVKQRIVLREIHLRTTGRHLSMGSHSITCYPTEVTAPQVGTRFIDPVRMKDWVSLLGWLHTEMVYPSTDGHPSEY